MKKRESARQCFRLRESLNEEGPGYLLWDNQGLTRAARPSSWKLSEAWILSCRATGLRGSEQKEGLNLQVTPGTFSSVLHAVPHTGQLAD